MEEGKRLALQHATGEYIVFVDADNEITHPDYIELAVKALAANPQALGVESYYLPSSKMSSFCAYLTHRLHISDPIAWLMSTNPKLVARDGEVERWTLPGDSLSYPLGANGFVFRRADLESVKADAPFQDTHAALHLIAGASANGCGFAVAACIISTCKRLAASCKNAAAPRCIFSASRRRQK